MKIKVGDTVHLKAEVREVSASSGTFWVTLEGDTQKNYVRITDRAVVEHFPKPIEYNVGDIVEFNNATPTPTVLKIVGKGEDHGEAFLMVVYECNKHRAQIPWCVKTSSVRPRGE